jgi:hypothetical protein
MGMMGSLFGNYMNITKITTEVYNWDAAINLSREDAIKFAKDILELCGETFSTTIKEYSPVIKPVQYALKDPTTKSYDIFSNEEKIQYVDAKQNYAKSLVYSMDLASLGWRMPTIVDVINNQHTLYKQYGEELFSLFFWTNSKGTVTKTQKCVSFEKSTTGNTAFTYHVHDHDKSIESTLLLVRD